MARSALCILLALGIAAAGCGGDPEPLPPIDEVDGDPCETVDDCGEELLCVLGRCRAECVGYVECPLGSACLEDATSGERGCRLEDEATCEAGSCPAGTECSDGRCRAECTSSASCGGTVCVAAESLCEDPAESHIECPDQGSYCSSGVCAEFGCDVEFGVALGETLTCVVRDSGALDCAGSDAGGLLGDGAAEPAGGLRASLAPVTIDEPVQQVALGAEHACALLFGSEVRCWGAADSGQTAAAGATDTPTLAIAPPADEVGTIDALTVGASHGCVHRANGVVECWGSDDAGQLGDEAVHPACASGAPCSAVPVAVAGVEDAIQLDAGRHATCAVRESGAISCWGRADTGLFGAAGEGTATCTLEGGATVACRPTPTDVPGLETAHAVSVGDGHACALDDDGVVWCWGDSSMGQAGVATGIVPPTEVILPIAAVAIATGRAHSCALGVDDIVWCWGANGASQLGDAGATAGPVPTRVEGVPRAFELASGSDHVCAQTTDLEIWCWGRNAEGQLARGESGAAGAPGRVTR